MLHSNTAMTQKQQESWSIPKKIKKLQSELLSRDDKTEKRGLELIREAVYELTSFVFNELGAAATHIKHQSGLIRDLQSRLSESEVNSRKEYSPKSSRSGSPQRRELEAVSMAKKNFKSTAAIKEVVTTLVTDFEELENRIEKMELIQSKHLEITKKNDIRARSISTEVSKAEAVIETLREEQLKFSQATIQNKVDALSKNYRLNDISSQQPFIDAVPYVSQTNTNKLNGGGGGGGGGGDNKIRNELTATRGRMDEISHFVDQLRVDFDSNKRPTEYRLQRLESSLSESHSKMQILTRDTSQLKTDTRSAVQV